VAAAAPDSLVIGIDANLDGATRVMRRARRAPEKGGLPNLTFVLAPADDLPGELAGQVNELHVDLPWGSLLDGVLTPGGTTVLGLATALAQSGVITIVLNARALPDGLDPPAAEERLRLALESAGLSDVHVGSTGIRPETGWGKRLAGGRALEVIVADARRPAA
jgi:16S rRNA (adenine(1408)-N(1))-methyltransferase